jgi:Annexin
MAIRYKELYNVELYDLMKKEFSGDFGRTVKFLALPADKAECAMIHTALKGIGSNVNIIWSILIGRTNVEIERMKKTYFTMYTKDLSKRLASELHGNMERLIFNSIQASEEKYDPQYHTMDKALEDAETLHSQGQGKWGTDEKGIFKIIFAAPPEYLKMINTVYSDKYGYTLEKVMEKEMGGELKDAAMHYVSMKLKPYHAMAELIKMSCAGFGTDELLLTCTIIRYQEVMPQIMQAHIELFGKTVHDRVRSECGGQFKNILLQVLNTAWPEAG